MIPGTTCPERIDEDAGALDVELTAEELQTLDRIASSAPPPAPPGRGPRCRR